MSPHQKLLPFKKYAQRKVIRPLSTRAFNHLVLKARRPVLRLNTHLVQAVLIETQRRFGIELRTLSVMPDHIHLVLKVRSRKQWADALRFFAGQVALKLKQGKLWAQRAWSRVVQAGRDYRGVIRYVSRNPFKAGIADLRIDSLWILNGFLFGDLQSPPRSSLNNALPHSSSYRDSSRHCSLRRPSPERVPLPERRPIEQGAFAF